jgi:hypothetical protein
MEDKNSENDVSDEKKLDAVEEKISSRDAILRDLASNLSSYHILKIRLSGSVFIGNFRLPGWSDELPFYAFKCEKHGFVVNYPTGYEQRLICPFCVD